jgi:hypothetical protein
VSEHFGIVTVEAMGAGCIPVVSGFLWLMTYTTRLARDECKAVHGCWCGVYPWGLQNYRCSRGLAGPRVGALDGSVATRWGWYFMLLTVKPGRPG